MTGITPWIECFLSIHALLILGSWCIGGRKQQRNPSSKLSFTRLILVSCIFSPIVIHFFKPTEKPLLSEFIPIDTWQNRALPLVKPQMLIPNTTSEPSFIFHIPNFNLSLFIVALLSLAILLHIVRLLKDLQKLRSILRSAIHYHSHNKLSILVSDQCTVPFALRSLHKAHIVLPISLLNSPADVKIAIAHEGQHHRQGDCIWAYFMEVISIVFLGNPALRRWRRILNELQELACDEALVGHRMISAHDYGQCLFKVAQTVFLNPAPNHRKFACTIGMMWGSGNQQKSFLTRRICMLSQYQKYVFQIKKYHVVTTFIALAGPFCLAYATKGTLSSDAAQQIDPTSFDSRIQNIVQTEIASAVQNHKAKSGAIAVADPHTGKIIAFAQSGATKGTDNWESRIFAPGSTIKPFVAAAAINSGTASESQIYDCRSPYYVDGTKFTNHTTSFTDVSLTDAMAKSVNVCLIKVAQNTGPAVLRKTFNKFGLNIDWQADKSDDLQLANSSLGKTTPVTLAGITKAYAILANKGHTFSGNDSNAISESTANSVTRMLIEAVQTGTGKRAAVDGLSVAGKTGTLAVESKGSTSSYLALFGGYFPAAAPRFVVFVVLESTQVNDMEKASGGSLAAPAFHKVAVKSLESTLKAEL